jgi:hypothetical protein
LLAAWHLTRYVLAVLDAMTAIVEGALTNLDKWMKTDISHENLHQPTSDLLWRESYYFNLLGSDLAIETTIGLRPHQGIIERMALVFHQGQTLIFIDPGRLEEFTPSALQTDSVALNCVTPLQQWQVCIADEFLVLPPGEETELMSFILEVQNGRPVGRRRVALDLAFQGVMLPYLYPSGALDFMGSDTQHYEQVGQWTGTAQIGDDVMYQVASLGVRDHSWGVRDWLRAEEWYWVNVLYPDKYLALGYGRAAGGNWTGSGFIHTKGVTHPLHQIGVEAEHDDNTTMLVGGALVEARTNDTSLSVAGLSRQRGVQLIPARGTNSLLRMSTNVGAARDRVWLLDYGRRERIGA